MRLLTKWAAILLISTGTVSIGFAQEKAAATADRTTSKASSKTAASSEKGAAAPSEVPVEAGKEAETAEPEPIETIDFAYSYLPLKVGSYVEYSVDSTVYNDFDKSVISYKFTLRETIVERFEDATGNATYDVLTPDFLTGLLSFKGKISY